MCAARYPAFLGEVRETLQEMRHERENNEYRYPRLQCQNMGHESYARFCGAMDCLLDMENALARFWHNLERGQTPTELECLGFLQALYLEQDSVREIGFTFDFPPLKKFDEYREGVQTIRDLRNRLAGHAAFSSQCKPPSSAMWLPASVTNQGFEMVVYYVSGSKHQFVDFRESIAENSGALAEQLNLFLFDLAARPKN